MPSAEKVCVIGAGSSGITACQVLDARGIPFDCFEKGSQIGGNWRYENDNGMSSAYRTLHINTSRRVMAYKALPMPDHYPDYPDHFQMAAYFDEFVDHFGLREKIRFRTEVLSAEPVDGEWEVSVARPDGDRERNRYRAVLVANGHHWDPRWPEPPFPGAEEFGGEQLHAHHYREPDVLRGKRVLVLGIGNSATDIAVESSRIADATLISMRRGAHVIPKYINGKPTDELSSPISSMLPLRVQRFFARRMLGIAVGDMTAYGLPQPDHKLYEAHPTVSSELLPRLGHGDIGVKPNIARFSGGRTIRFLDGSEEEIDLVVYCTGYKITFPFFDPEVFSAPDNRLPLYRRVVSVERPGLYFIGFIQPLGPIMPLAEAQCEWVADLLAGRAALPGAPEMRRGVEREERKMRKRFVASKRHTVEVDFHPYLREIRRERRQAGQRA
ncbi:MAG TPA: NAD(P)-binding domain-containing protein [Solirubrobacterales bacterium]|jgi:cation diffusion facilitator CzcD-associated flavoprotein CzcO|nr:NAD(P)-binding domain-containing protein [Solirubrobacterales bacterium]